MQLDLIYNMDCIDGMKMVPDGSVDLIVTDPPYRVTSRGGSQNSMSGYWVSELSRKGKIFQNNDIKIEQYLPDFYRVLKDGSHCYIMCNNLNLPHFFNVIDNSEFNFVKLLAWDKVTSICGRYYMGQIEHIFLLRKGRDKPVNDCGRSDLISVQNRKDFDRNGEPIHESQKPTQLFQVLISQSSDEHGVVLDPFMGSGTTAIACIKEKRHYIGFEIDKGYCDKACKRIELEKQQLTLF